MCKSAHQSFSHRVKSVTMSTWTLKEVRALSEKHGGGNKACIAKWLSSGDVEKYRPHPGDSLDKYKNFIRLAYEEKMFMAKGDAEEEPAEEAEEQPEEAPAAAAPAEEEDVFDEGPKKKAVKKAAPKKVQEEEEEDFGEEEVEELQAGTPIEEDFLSW